MNSTGNNNYNYGRRCALNAENRRHNYGSTCAEPPWEGSRGRGHTQRSTQPNGKTKAKGRVTSLEREHLKAGVKEEGRQRVPEILGAKVNSLSSYQHSNFGW